MTSWLAAQKNSPRQAMAAVSASPPIRAKAPAFVAGREAGLSIKPPLARNRQRYGADGNRDHQARCHLTAVISVITEITYFFHPWVQITLLFSKVITEK